MHPFHGQRLSARRAGHGFGRFGTGFIDDGLGGRSFGMGRKLASGDLYLLILALLAVKPSHGYEIMKDLEARSKRFYVPSPGMVYPALTYLEEIGYATVVIEGTRKLYHLTDAGREYLDANRDRADALLQQLERVGQRMERMRRAMGGGPSTAEDPAPHDENGPGGRRLILAGRDLKQALAEKWSSPRAEQERVAEILQRAIAEIGKQSPPG